jgi:uncharacterized membrane protein YoaK (UPF0700 family)
MEVAIHIHARLAALAAAAGCVDAAAFLGLDRVFPANQTGNTVLLGIALGAGDGQAALRTGVSIAAFVAGVMAAALLMRGVAPGWSGRVWRILLAQAAGLAVVAALWGPLGTPALIALVSAAMGVQSAAALRVGVPGVTTTFVTGTLTRIATQVVDRRQGPREAAPAAAWAAYLAGAVVGGLLSRWTDGGAGVLVAAAVIAVVALPLPAERRRA